MIFVEVFKSVLPKTFVIPQGYIDILIIKICNRCKLYGSQILIQIEQEDLYPRTTSQPIIVMKNIIL